MTKKTINDSTVKSKTVSGLFWRFMERFGAQGVTFVVSIILARLLEPNVYGMVSVVTVIMTLLDVFIDSGLGNALIQKKDADNLDFSTVFIFNCAICFLLYVLTYLLAPWIARFYQMPQLTAVIRVMGISLIISGLKNVQQAYVTRNMLFKRFFFATLGGTVGAAALGIWMAYKGFGVWALVAQGLFNSIVDTSILWLTVGWRPQMVFSFKRLKSLLSFGWKLLVTSLLGTLYSNMRQLIIGKMYLADSLAFYNRGYMIPNVFIVNINAAIESVLFPVMSTVQDDREALRAMTRRSIRVSSYIIWPIMLGLAACADPLVRVLLTEKWLPCVPFVRIFCIHYAFYPIHSANISAIKALGRTDILLKLEVVKKTIGIVVLLITMWYGVMAMAYSLLLISFSNQILNAWPNSKLMGYSYYHQIVDIFPSVILSFVMSIVVWSVQLLGFNAFITLVLQIVLGSSLYVIGSFLFKYDSLYYLIETGKELLHRNQVG